MHVEATARQRIALTVNGEAHEREVDVRMLLADFLRRELGLTGTHIGCEQGVCGACTVLIDGDAIRSCLTLAAQADGRSITTIEGFSPDPRQLDTIQETFREHHALQCGFCTPGFVVSVHAFLNETPNPTEDEIREALSGNLCRCTGYRNIVQAVASAAEKMQQSVASDGKDGSQ
jgi:aerobic carbon-monoxide dehydrogenase small subunit